MAETLLSTAWYRVAGLRPRLAPQLKVMRQPVRDQLWHVLSEAGSGRQLRLNPAAYEFVGRCDGSRSVGELWEMLLEKLGDDAPTQDDILSLLTRLHHSDMVQFDAAPNLAMLFERRARHGRRQRRAWINPFVIRLRLFDPTRLLDRMEPVLRPLFSTAGLWLWAVCVLLGLLACVLNFPALRSELSAHLDSPGTIWLLWLCYPPVKALHELGHALAVRRWGGQVHDAGITLLFFTPAPYVDASSANSFAQRRERAIVSACGIMVELFLAALALAVWLAVEPGMVRNAAFAVLLICSVSTLLFNGNPLMRLDGYYILCDALDLPNLALRSGALWASWWRRLALGSRAAPAGALAAGEFKWLVAYAPLSWAWRIGLLLALVGWAGAKSWLLGWLAAFAVLGWLLVPVLVRATRFVAAAGAGGMRSRAVGLLLLCVGAVALLLFAVPVPGSALARGVIWPPEHAQVRSETGGFVDVLTVEDGQDVQAGEVLLSLSEPTLVAEHDRRVAQLAGHQAQQYQALLADPLRASNLAQDIVRSEAEVARAQEQLSQLQVHSKVAGRLVLPHSRDLPGSFVAQGDLLGYILAPGPANVRAVLAEHEVELVRERARGVEVRLAEAPGVALPGLLAREAPAATRSLPSAALGERFGGPVPTDPADKLGLATLEPVFLLDVTVAEPLAGRIGARVWLRFDLGPEPLGLQWARRLRQLLLKHFNPSGQA